MGYPQQNLLPNKYKRILFVVLAFFMHYLLSYVMSPYSQYWKEYLHRPSQDVGLEWLITLMSCIGMSESSIRIDTYFNRRIPWDARPVKRIASQTVLQIAAVAILLLLQWALITLLFPTAPNEAPPSREELTTIWQWVIISVIIALAMSMVNTLDYLITSWKNAAIEAAEYRLRSAEHKQAAAEAELYALKLQIDPHFVFNNLSVLSELILKDQQLGYEYAENFSKVYRYLLTNSDKDVISLEQELRFLQAYIFLISKRAGDNVVFDIAVDPRDKSRLIPPFTLQLLVENALKHNKALKTEPLRISISTSAPGEVLVANNLNPIVANKPPSSGKGLNNIIARYALLSDKIPVACSTNDSFHVRIPLIDYDKKHSHTGR